MLENGEGVSVRGVASSAAEALWTTFKGLGATVAKLGHIVIRVAKGEGLAPLDHRCGSQLVGLECLSDTQIE
jgi:hypothetical protein